MTSKTEALKLALEALKTCGEDEWHSDDDYGMMQFYDEDKVNEAITAIKEALAQPEQRPWVGLTGEEIDVIYEQHHNQYGECESPNFGYERAIEAKLKEKNMNDQTEASLKLALELAKIRWDGPASQRSYADKMVIDACEKALAQPEPLPVQEPVGGEWTPCMKLPIVVHVRKQRSGEAHVSTREGITPVKPDDLIMRGVSGEEYPIGRAIFEQTYSLDTATPQRQPLTPAQRVNIADAKP